MKIIAKQKKVLKCMKKLQSKKFEKHKNQKDSTDLHNFQTKKMIIIKNHKKKLVM